MAQYSFGSGVMYGRSLVNSPATPVRFGGLQGCTIDIAFTVKELHGQYQFPIAIGRGTGKITGKADFAQFNAQVFNDLFFGMSNPATGSTRTAVSEAQTVTANIVTATHNGASVYVADLGVVLAADGTVYTRVTSAPAGFQYSVNETTGVYTFNASQANAPVLVNYKWTDAANGKLITLSNQLLGNSPTFSAVFTETFESKSLTLCLNKCISSKLSLVTKLEDFTTPDFSFMALADVGGNIGTLSLDE